MPTLLLSAPPPHAAPICPLASVEKSVVMSFAMGDGTDTRRWWGYEPHHLTPYEKSISAKLRARTRR